MMLTTFYPEIKLAHVAFAATSGTLFALRGALVLGGQRWAMARPLRLLVIVVDTLLLAAGALLWHLLALNPLHQRWLAVKLGAIVAYIVLGSFALRRARSAGGRAAAYLGALALFGFVVSVARSHSALGVLR